LQGVDRATLAIVPKKCRHRAALLSRLSEVKIPRPAKESKPIGPMSTFGSRMRRCQRIVRDVVSDPIFAPHPFSETSSKRKKDVDAQPKAGHDELELL
jgi:hypothetical protein